MKLDNKCLMYESCPYGFLYKICSGTKCKHYKPKHFPVGNATRQRSIVANQPGFNDWKSI